MKQNVSNQIPKGEGYNIAKQMRKVDDRFFIGQVESMDEVFAKIREVSN